jgi:MFS transporter, CP family, cyanate transporter
MSAGSPRHARGAAPWLVVIGVLVAALSLRAPIVAPTPVLRDIARDLGVGAAAAGLLTTAPVLAFAVLTPLAALVIRRSGAEIALLLSLSGVLIGTFVRAVPGFGWMLAGTLVIGAAITIGNVVIPVIIRRDVSPERVGVVTAAYVAMLNAGSLITSLATAPLADAVGWPTALLLWSSITVAGLLLWSLHLARERRSGSLRPGARGAEPPLTSGPVPTTSALDPVTLTGPVPLVERGAASSSFARRPIVWLLLVVFAGQTTMYYSLTTWLPTLAADELGLDRAAAGLLASIFQGVAVVGAFVVPLLSRVGPPALPMTVIGACWLVLTFGTLLAPEMLAVWLAVGAVAHAGGFVVVFTILVGVARSDGEAAGMSALVQGGGYAVGAVGAPVMGALSDVAGGWDVPLTVLCGVAVFYCAALTAAYVSARRTR